jgi:formylglycine-generating enzyme required for sulfatase activity
MLFCTELFSCIPARQEALREGNRVQSVESPNLLNRKRVPIRLAGRRQGFTILGRIAAAASIAGPLVIAGAVMCLASQGKGNELARGDFDVQFAELKAKTDELVASARPHLDALSPQQRLSAPPAIWKVPGTLMQFQDCADCPQMIVIPAGEFTMGSPPSDGAAEAQHRVTIAHPFAVSKFEIAFSEWDACVTDGGCGGYWPDDQGWGRGNQPVINISWENAKSYVEWLSRKTGKRYRLLSESEWEYAARAGSTTRFSHGDTLSPSQANYDGSADGSGPSEVNRQRTVAVGSFPPNGFGLHDMHGNVAEWVEDCWHDEYTATAPTDGSAWVDGNCNGRVVRGGSWEDSEVEHRSAARTGGDKRDQFYTDGLRIARGL